MDIGRRIKEVREEYGMSGVVLARRAGVTSAHLNMIEHGSRMPSLGLLERIARELRTEPAEFLRGPGAEVGDFPPKVQAPLPFEAGGRELDYWTLYLTRLADHFEDLADEEVEPCRRYGRGDVAPGVAGDALAAVEVLLDGVRDGTVVATTAAVRSALRAGFRLAKAADRIDELATPSEEDLMQGGRRRQAQVLAEIRFRQIVEAYEDVVSEEDREAIFS